jgi:uncharacterized protein
VRGKEEDTIYQYNLKRRSILKTKLIFVAMIFVSLTHAESKTEKIHKLLDLMGSEKNLAVMKTQMAGIIKKASPEVPTALLDTLFIKMNKEGLYNITTKIYDKNLDEETIDALIAFYKTNAGKTFVEKMPLILQESLQVGAAWGQQIMMDALQILKERGYKVQ